MYNFHAIVCFTGHLHLTEGLRTTLLFNLGVVGGGATSSSLLLFLVYIFLKL